MPEQATIDFWFDANCPYTWRTANWVRAAAQTRSVTVRWHLMSLYRLDSRNEATLPAMRVLAAAEAGAEGDAAGKDAVNAVIERLYFAMGRRLHDEGRPAGDAVFREALAEVGLPADLAGAGGRTTYDEGLFRSHDAGQAAVGEEAGSPVLSVNGTQAFFGPVLTSVPAGDEGLRLLDAFMAAATVHGFTELKRSRSQAA